MALYEVCMIWLDSNASNKATHIFTTNPNQLYQSKAHLLCTDWLYDSWLGQAWSSTDLNTHNTH